jgi:lipopolysaccharide export system ATP-binding protein
MKHRLPKPKSPKKTDRIMVDEYSGSDIDNGKSITAAGPLPKEESRPKAKSSPPPLPGKKDEKSEKTDDLFAPKPGDPFPPVSNDSTPAAPEKSESKKDEPASRDSSGKDAATSKESSAPPEASPTKESASAREGPSPAASATGKTQPYLIQTRGLVKQYGGRRVVNGVDIHVRPGEVVGLLGKNGAGKTTTFYMIVGLVAPTEGHVFMGDEDVTHMPMYRRARRGIGYLPQEESIFRKLTVEENLLAILETLPMTEDERDARCDELLKDFHLEHVRENVAITLSGGEKRRVTIARALVTSPQLLLLDEPFAGVDPMAVHDIQEIIQKLKAKGIGILLTDHSVRETLSSVDRAYIINDGTVLSEGTRDFILNDPIAREIYLGHRFSM